MASCSSDVAESSNAPLRRAGAASQAARYREKSWFVEDLETDPSPEVIARLITRQTTVPLLRPQASRAHSSPVVLTLKPPPGPPTAATLNKKERKKRPSSGFFSFLSPPAQASSASSPPLQRRSSLFRRGSLSPAVKSTGTQPFPSEQEQGSYFPPERDWRFWRRRRSVAQGSDDGQDDSRRKSFAFGEREQPLSPLEPPRLRVNSSGLAPRSSSPLVNSIVSDEEPSPTTLEMINEAANESSPPLVQAQPTPKDLSFRKLPKEMWTSQHTRRRSGSAAEVLPGLPVFLKREEASRSIRRRAVSLLGLTRPSWVSEEFGTGSDDESNSIPAPVVTAVSRRMPGLPPARVSSLPPTPLMIPSMPSFPALSASTSTSTVDHEPSPIEREREETESVARPSSDESDGDWQRKMKERERERERWWALSKRAGRDAGPRRVRV